MFSGPPGSTPLQPDDIDGLIPDLQTRAELNEFEQSNIAHAYLWASTSRTVKTSLLSAATIKEIHRKMFDRTWTWAGEFRKRETNLGINWIQIPIQIKNLCDDTKFKLNEEKPDFDYLGAWFHHRLVSIHPFPNGNGRHARLTTDLLLKTHGISVFSWGRANLGEKSETREIYIDALRKADEGDLEALKNFVRS